MGDHPLNLYLLYEKAILSEPPELRGRYFDEANHELPGPVGCRSAFDRTAPTAYGRDDHPGVQHDDRSVPERIGTRDLTTKE